MTLSVSLRPLFTGKTVGTADIAAAVALVKADGVREASIKPLVDAFVAATGEGRVSATTRQAFQKALLALVQQLPRTPSSVVMRRDEGGLGSSIQQTQTVIGKQTTRIAGLEAEVQTLSTSLVTKKAEADGLLVSQKSLETALSSAIAEKQDNQLLNTLIFMFTKGASAAVTGMATINGVQIALSIGEMQTKQAELAAQIATTQRTASQLQQQVGVVQATVAAQRSSLDGLQLLESSLRSQLTATPAPTSTATLAERLNGLAVSLEVHQALSNNLGKQIEVLEQMKAGLTTANVGLDSLIVALKADNDSLRTEIASTERSIKSDLIDLAMSISGIDKTIDIGALSLSTKALLLDGVDGLRLQVLAQARALANNTITTSALGVSSSSALGRLFLSVLNNDTAAVNATAAAIVDGAVTDAVSAATAAHGMSNAGTQMVLAMLNNDPSGVRVAALDGILDNVDSLTAPQRFLIEQLLFAPRASAAPLSSDMVLQAVRRVVADPSINESRARAIVNTVTTTDATTWSSEPVLNSLVFAADVRIGEATATTSRLFLVDAADGSLGRLAHLPLQDLTLCGGTHTAAGLLALQALPSLTSLAVSTRKATTDEVKAVATLRTIEHLDITLDPADVGLLTALPALTSLKAQRLDDASLAMLSTLPNLHSLDVSYGDVTGTGIAAAGLTNTLTTIDLGGTTQSAADLAALATVPHLTTLRMGYANVAQADLLQLAASPSLLKVYVNGVDNVDVASLNVAVGRDLFSNGSI